MNKPIKGSKMKNVTIIDAYRHACPVPEYVMLENEESVYLVGAHRHMSVSKQAMPILMFLDGNATLDQIESKIGKLGVDFIATLVVNGLVRLT